MESASATPIYQITEIRQLKMLARHLTQDISEHHPPNAHEVVLAIADALVIIKMG